VDLKGSPDFYLHSPWDIVDLGTRPTFHWKPRRIHAHFCGC